MNEISIAYPRGIEKLGARAVRIAECLAHAWLIAKAGYGRRRRAAGDSGWRGVRVDSHVLRDIGMTRMEFELGIRARSSAVDVTRRSP